MTEQHPAARIEPETAGHLAAAMKASAVPGPATLAVARARAGEQHWPDGTGKRRHPKEHYKMSGRAGHEAAVTAVHRTARPQVPHSS